VASDWDGCPLRVRVILDTNALMMPLEFGIDLFGNLTELLGACDTYVLDEVIGELRGLTIGSGRNPAAARFGLAVSARCTEIPPLDEDIPVDDKIVRRAEEFNAIVVTNDKALRKKLLDKRIPVVVLRSRSRLELIGK